jgi:hypothetical protein
LTPLRPDGPHAEAHERLERMAVDLAFNANAVVELGAAAPLSPSEVRSAADDLKHQADQLSPRLGEGDRVLRFARLVLDGLEHELDQAVLELPISPGSPPGPDAATNRRAADAQGSGSVARRIIPPG